MAEIPIRSFAVSVFILRQTAAKTQVLLMERADSLVGAWCQVAGSLEQDETAWQAALREVLEETGLVPDKLYSGDICEQFYEHERECISIFPVFVHMSRRIARWFSMKSTAHTVGSALMKRANSCHSRVSGAVC